VVSASGRLRGEAGRLHIGLTVGSSHTASRSLTVVITPRRCGAARRCLRLAGTLKGTLSYQAHQIPDTGARLSLRASGVVKPIGAVSASGFVHGTGFIRSGRETLQLTLAGSGARVSVEGRSSLLPGFTAP
jgi:hypothetical protein